VIRAKEGEGWRRIRLLEVGSRIRLKKSWQHFARRRRSKLLVGWYYLIDLISVDESELLRLRLWPCGQQGPKSLTQLRLSVNSAFRIHE